MYQAINVSSIVDLDILTGRRAQWGSLFLRLLSKSLAYVTEC